MTYLLLLALPPTLFGIALAVFAQWYKKTLHQQLMELNNEQH